MYALNNPFKYIDPRGTDNIFADLWQALSDIVVPLIPGYNVYDLGVQTHAGLEDWATATQLDLIASQLEMQGEPGLAEFYRSMAFEPYVNASVHGLEAAKDIIAIEGNLVTAATVSPANTATGVKPTSVNTKAKAGLVDDSAKLAGDVAKNAESKGKVPPQLLRGQDFEKIVLDERQLTKNTSKVGKSIPDSQPPSGNIVEVKDVNYQYKNGQFRDYLSTGRPVDLIIAPQTKVSEPLYKAIIKSGGEVLIRVTDNYYVPYKPNP